MNTLRTLLAGACLSALLAGPAAALTPAAETAPAAASDDGFGPMRQLAGSCWKADSAPAFEICYWFDASGRTLNARQYVGGLMQSEASVAASSRPGWLLETVRWGQSPYTVVQHLRVDAAGGRVWREPVRPIHDADRAEVDRRRAGWVVDSIRMMGADRFVFVRRTGAAVGRDWARPAEPTVASWSFTRSRPCDDEDLAGNTAPPAERS